MAHRLHPAQPLATGFVFTLPRQLPRRTDASAIGVQPQTDQELWVGVLSSCAAFHRGNLLVIAAQIQSPHQLPNRTYAVIVIYQLLHIHRPQEHLPTINRYQPRNSRRVAHHVRSLHTSTQPTATNFFTRSRRNVYCYSPKRSTSGTYRSSQHSAPCDAAGERQALLCFHIYLRCPLGFSKPPKVLK